jgi:hypothetical protein
VGKSVNISFNGVRPNEAFGSPAKREWPVIPSAHVERIGVMISSFRCSGELLSKKGRIPLLLKLRNAFQKQLIRKSEKVYGFQKARSQSGFLNSQGFEAFIKSNYIS